jgi:hypothetical protein
MVWVNLLVNSQSATLSLLPALTKGLVWTRTILIGCKEHARKPQRQNHRSQTYQELPRQKTLTPVKQLILVKPYQGNSVHIGGDTKVEQPMIDEKSVCTQNHLGGARLRGSD